MNDSYVIQNAHALIFAILSLTGARSLTEAFTGRPFDVENSWSMHRSQDKHKVGFQVFQTTWTCFILFEKYLNFGKQNKTNCIIFVWL